MRILPNRDVYEKQYDERDRIANEQDYDFVVQHIDFRRDVGILVYYEGAEYPKKGPAEPEALYGANVVKKLLVYSVKLMKNWEFMLLGLIFLLKTKKYKIKFVEKLFDCFNIVCEKAIDGVLIKRCYMTPTAKTLDLLVYKTLINMGFDEVKSNKFARYLSSVIDFDDAYRYRFQDAMSEINNDDLFKNPANEFIRVMKIYQSRDYEGISSKITAITPAIKIIFKYKWFKQAFMKALKEVNINDMKFDTSDIYWTNMRADYKFRGLEHSEREKLVTKFPRRVIKLK